MTMAEVRKYRKAHGLCTHCGKEKDNPNLAQCKECRTATYLARKKFKASPHPKPGKALTISEVCRMAAERHMSYGEMVVLIEKEGVYR